eukprot:453300-Pyramimonas_sp.AAC.1
MATRSPMTRCTLICPWDARGRAHWHAVRVVRTAMAAKPKHECKGAVPGRGKIATSDVAMQFPTVESPQHVVQGDICITGVPPA